VLTVFFFSSVFSPASCLASSSSPSSCSPSLELLLKDSDEEELTGCLATTTVTFFFAGLFEEFVGGGLSVRVFFLFLIPHLLKKKTPSVQSNNDNNDRMTKHRQRCYCNHHRHKSGNIMPCQRVLWPNQWRCINDNNTGCCNNVASYESIVLIDCILKQNAHQHASSNTTTHWPRCTTTPTSTKFKHRCISVVI